MWYPIHAGIEIFFDGNTADNYKVCEIVEDLSCAMQYVGNSVADHLFYLGIQDNCPGDGDHWLILISKAVNSLLNQGWNHPKKTIFWIFFFLMVSV